MFQRNIGHQGVNHQFPVPDLPLEPFGFHYLFINSIEELEQRIPQLGYISSFNTCSRVKILLIHNHYLPKIVHEQAFHMGAHTEGEDISQLGDPLLQFFDWIDGQTVNPERIQRKIWNWKLTIYSKVD